MTMFVGAVWKCNLVLLFYILEPAEVLHKYFPFVSLVSPKPKGMCIKKS